MRLHRIASISFDGMIEHTGTVAAQVGDVHLETGPVTIDGNPDKRFLITATIELPDGVSFDGEGIVLVPE